MASISGQPHSEARAGLASCPLPSKPTDASAPPDPYPAPEVPLPETVSVSGWRIALKSVCLRVHEFMAYVPMAEPCACTCVFLHLLQCVDMHGLACAAWDPEPRCV